MMALHIILVAFILGATSMEIVAVQTTKSPLEYNEITESNECSQQRPKMKSCPNGTCITFTASCSKHCGEGTKECADYTCVNYIAGNTCKTCLLGEKMCGNGNCTGRRESCRAPCGPREIECHDGTCERFAWQCDCSDQHHICSDGSCEYYRFHCPHETYKTWDSGESGGNSYSGKDFDEEDGQNWLIILLGVGFSFISIVMCLAKKRSVQNRQDVEGSTIPLQATNTYSIGSRRVPELQNLPSHYPVPVGARPRAVPLLQPPDYYDIVDPPAESNNSSTTTPMGPSSDSRIQPPPPSYENAIQML